MYIALRVSYFPMVRIQGSNSSLSEPNVSDSPEGPADCAPAIPPCSSLMWILARGILCCGGNIQIHTDYRNPVEKKGLHGHSLSQREGPETQAWTGFYCFSRHITSRMVLFYYAKVCFEWLPFTENKGEDVANYIKKEGYLQM